MAALPFWFRTARRRAAGGDGKTPAAATPQSAAVRAQQIRLLYQNSIGGIVAGSVMFAVSLVALIQNGLMSPGLWLWAIASAVCFCVGYAQLIAYRHTMPGDEALPAWGRAVIAGGTVAGILWGTVTFFLDGALRGYEIPVVSGLVLLLVGAVAGYAVYAPAIFGFSSGIAIMSVLGMLSTEGPFHWVLAIMILAVFAMVVQFGLAMNRAYTRALVLDAENKELIGTLTQKQRELELAAASRLQFFSSASHDLRQPMHALGLFAEALRDFVVGRQGQEIFGRMSTSIAAMEQLIDQVLSVANLDAGAVVAKPVRMPVQYLFDSLQGSYEPLAQAKSLRLRFAPTRAVIETDPMLIGRLVGNLISNAIRYTQRGGVLVGCRRRGLQWRLDVVDTGPGIAQEHLERIFEEFVQLNNPERDRSKGLGLGLAIVRRIGALLGHEVRVVSRLTRGSRFSVSIACPLGAEPLSSLETSEAESPALVGGLLIVVVDDERDIRDALEVLLSRWGAFVVSAASGKEALEKLELEARLPDLVICDLRLTGAETGIDVIQAIRKHFEHDVASIIVSGDTSPQRVAEVRAAGLDIVHKPLSPSKLRALIAASLSEE